MRSVRFIAVVSVAISLVVCATSTVSALCAKCRYGHCFGNNFALECWETSEGCVTGAECNIAGPTCFLADAEVATADGQKRIQDLQVGDWVLSGLEGGRPAYGMVVNKYRAVAGSYYVVNGTIRVTGSHPFWVGGEWVKASDLSIGEEVLAMSGPIEVLSIEHVQRGVRVYNIEVNGAHTFFAETVLVHNKR